MAKLSSAELAKREDVIQKMKKNKRSLVKRYGPDAEKVMYGRATNIAKKVAESEMEKTNLKELVRAALMNEKKKSFPDLTGDGKVTKADILKGRGIELKEGPEDRDWATYVKSLVNDIRLNGVEGYVDYSEDDFIVDYEEYIGGKMVGEDYDPDQAQLDDEDEIPMSYDDEGKPLGLGEDLDLGHEDDEPHMIKSELYRIGKYSMELYQMVDQFEGEGEVDFPAWWQAKITTAKNMVSSAKHYLEFELKEPEIDAMVGVATGEDIIPNIPSEPLEDEIEEGLPKGYFKKATAELDESFEKLVGKLKKGGKSEKAAKAIAGAVASYKAKGGGKGLTAKQKARINEIYFLAMDKYVPGFGEIENSDLYKYKVVYYKDKEGKQPIAQTIFKYEPNHDKIFAAMNSSNYFDKKDVQLYKAFDTSGKEYPIAGDPKDISLSTLKAVGFRKAPELGWQAG